MTVQETFDEFILSRRRADLSRKTIYAYTSFVSPFVAYVGSERSIESLLQSDINKYIDMLLERPLSRSTRSTYIRHIKTYLRWCECEQEYLVNYTYKRIKVPKPSKRVVRIYSERDVSMMFESVTADCEWIVARNRCIIALMYDSGLRQAEVCLVQLRDITFPDGRMIVHGKGNKDRYVPLGDLTRTYLDEYMRLCPFSSDMLFVGRRGQPLTCNAVKLLVSKLSHKLSFDLSSHKLRHNFATNYCVDQYERYGRIDIFQLMYLMGHEDIETTERYLHFAYEVIASKGHISHLDTIFN